MIGRIKHGHGAASLADAMGLLYLGTPTIRGPGAIERALTKLFGRAAGSFKVKPAPRTAGRCPLRAGPQPPPLTCRQRRALRRMCYASACAEAIRLHREFSNAVHQLGATNMVPEHESVRRLAREFMPVEFGGQPRDLIQDPAEATT
jgi:hypothetical protein